MKGYSLHILILFTLIQRYQSLFNCKTGHKPKRDISPLEQYGTKDSTVDLLNHTVLPPSSKQKADLVLIIDVSGSIDDKTKETIKENLRKLAKSKSIDIGEDKVRVSIIAFAEWAQLVLGLHEGVTPDAVINSLDRMNWGHETNIVLGLNLAKQQFMNATDRPEVQKVAILISDGAENCRPDQVINSPRCARNYAACNYIAANCSRPPGARCRKSNTTAVFGEFADLKKAGGSNGSGVTLAIIGVGEPKWVSFGRSRLQCWSSEGLYRELPSYSKLKKTIESLLTTLVPKNPAADCECYYIYNETCKIHNGICGRYLYINITYDGTSNGRPCPDDREWAPCQDRKCGLVAPAPPNRKNVDVVQPGKPPKEDSGVAWWVIFVALMGALAVILVIAIIMVILLRRRRVRRKVTAGVQPSVRESLTERIETPSQLSAAAISENVQRSAKSVSRSIQPSTILVESVQQDDAPMKVGCGVGKAGRAAASVKGVATKSAAERSKGVQPGDSLRTSSVSNYQSPLKTGLKVPPGASVADYTAAALKAPSEKALRKTSLGKGANDANAAPGKIPSKKAFKKPYSSKLVKDGKMG